MASTFNLKIVTPENTIYDGDIIHLLAPGVVGYLGVLVDHAPLVTPLKRGDVKVKTADKSEKTFTIKGGFLEVGHNEALLLAEGISSE